MTITNEKVEVESRLCVGAAVGLLWSIAFVAVAIPTWLMVSAVEPDATVSLGQRVFQAICWLSLAGILGGPVVSAVASNRIRHSSGQLTGQGMAVAGVMLIPLTLLAGMSWVALDLLIDAVTDNDKLAQALSLLAGCVVLIVAAMVLARAVRRAR